MKTRFLFHAEAAAATGQLTLPYHELIPVPASASVPSNGGHAQSSADAFSHRGIISFRRAEVHAIGAYSSKDDAHASMSTALIEGLNILNTVTCDRIVMRMAGKHPCNGSEPEFVPLGSHFVNLRIAGYPLDVNLATDVFTQYPTWSKLSQAYHHDAAVRADIDQLSLVKPSGTQIPVGHHGNLGVTLARNLGQLPPGLQRRDHGIYVPQFGTVYLGEYFLSPRGQRLLMLHVDLGCGVEGCGGIGGGQVNGSDFP